MPEKNVDKYKDLTRGMTTAVFNKLGGMEGAARFLAGMMTPQEFFRLWYEDEGIIYLSPISFGWNSQESWERMLKKGWSMGEAVGSAWSEGFKPTAGVMFQLAVIKGWNERNEPLTLSEVRSIATSRLFRRPTNEILSLICNTYSIADITQSMNLEWICLDTPFKLFMITGSRLSGGCVIEEPMVNDQTRCSNGGFVYIVSETPIDEMTPGRWST